ncbi:redoxin domain-containing protein [Aggregatimonas sangjinii]|uniref:Redoxin domain-containing protein n=1 Tax=Aggregatimonas sangjinii TaxID=2583587 RepID=A0A5B7STH2_9FLAO|nr:TlpA disulfide reductase family protein [Aggregatimonas sangjinii]QCW99993.1 redoxin domain-containing protein [Aggregatimonas sangjinii]
MKKVILGLITTFALISCNQKPEGYEINGTLTGDVEEGTAVYLKAIGDDNQPTPIDTATVTNGTFQFVGTAGLPEMHYIFIDKTPGYTAVILENGEIDFTAQKDSLGFAKISGTPQNDIFADYLKQSKGISERANSIQADMQKASASKDQATITALQEEMGELQEEYKNFELDYIKNNPNGLISALLVDRALASRQLTAEEVRALYDGLSAEIKETKAAKGVLERLVEFEKKAATAKSTEVGAVAPEFSAPDPDGNQIALSDVKGKLTLIDFWAAWCKPCRAENPNVVNVYNKYHDKGLNIIGVSLDRKADDWKKAITADNLSWNQVSNVAYFNDPVAKLYNVDAIPAAFLLDENGVIVAKNLRGPALEAKVAELLN